MQYVLIGLVFRQYFLTVRTIHDAVLIRSGRDFLYDRCNSTPRSNTLC